MEDQKIFDNNRFYRPSNNNNNDDRDRDKSEILSWLVVVPHNALTDAASATTWSELLDFADNFKHGLVYDIVTETERMFVVKMTQANLITFLQQLETRFKLGGITVTKITSEREKEFDAKRVKQY